MKIKAVIDRFETTKAVLLIGEAETQVKWPRVFLPETAQEGDILTIDLQIDTLATLEAKAEVEDLLQQIIAKNRQD